MPSFSFSDTSSCSKESFDESFSFLSSSSSSLLSTNSILSFSLSESFSFFLVIFLFAYLNAGFKGESSLITFSLFFLDVNSLILSSFISNLLSFLFSFLLSF